MNRIDSPHPPIPLARTAIILLASGLSRRYGRRDKMLADLGGKPLIDHAAGVIAGMDPLVRVAVCPFDRKEIGEHLINRFVVAVNQRPRDGLGHSISVGVKVAQQFKPDAMLIAMGDMAFIEEWMLLDLVEGLRPGIADIVHSGSLESPRPPTAFGAACFEALGKLDGDEGARPVLKSGRFRVTSIDAPSPLLLDVDTRDDIELARAQHVIRERCRRSASRLLEAPRPVPAANSFEDYREGARAGGRR